ncbi:MAG: hypothetical protein V4564_16005 [Pseudomonadota bacterium]|uniref:hypothetical protein n=1 Tax=Sphingomonas sp. ERG5 TaxID=1381597 RepID=UPI00054BC9B6|nr:hypothetical protein [Sphingomonas sp. ERG5]
MRPSRFVWPILIATQLCAGPVFAIAAAPPERVGPSAEAALSTCRTSITFPGGRSPGPAIPIRALRLGAVVVRSTASFSTGGSGTAYYAEMARRKAAGLPFEPVLVDPAVSTPATVFTTTPPINAQAMAYQRLRVKQSPRYAEQGMIFALSDRANGGRIASVGLTLQAAPTTPPRTRVSFISRPNSICGQRPIDIYAPAMSAAQVTALLRRNGCRWVDLSACKQRSEWPRGRVLFVQQYSGGGYDYRWVDYDQLAVARFRTTPFSEFRR